MSDLSKINFGGTEYNIKDTTARAEVAKKVTASGGDTANTKISSVTASTESFPVPVAGETHKAILGKIIKFFNDVKAFKNTVVTLSMISQQILNDPNKIASMAALYSVNESVTQLNRDFAKAKYATDLFADYADPTFVAWYQQSQNTPYTAGLTSGAEGFAIVFGSYSTYHTVIAWQKGGATGLMWEHVVNGGTDFGWKQFASKDDLDAIVSTTGVINPNGSEFTVDIAGITASWCPIIQLMDCLQTVTRITCPFTGRLSVTLSGVVNGNIRYVLWYRKK